MWRLVLPGISTGVGSQAESACIAWHKQTSVSAALCALGSHFVGVGFTRVHTFEACGALGLTHTITGLHAPSGVPMKGDLLTQSPRHRDYGPASTNKMWHRIPCTCGQRRGSRSLVLCSKPKAELNGCQHLRGHLDTENRVFFLKKNAVFFCVFFHWKYCFLITL